MTCPVLCGLFYLHTVCCYAVFCTDTLYGTTRSFVLITICCYAVVLISDMPVPAKQGAASGVVRRRDRALAPLRRVQQGRTKGALVCSRPVKYYCYIMLLLLLLLFVIIVVIVVILLLLLLLYS